MTLVTVMGQWWSDSKRMYCEETCPSDTLPATDPTCTAPERVCNEVSVFYVRYIFIKVIVHVDFVLVRFKYAARSGRAV